MSKGEATRELILNKALGIASTQGLEGLSIGGVAKEVGMSKSGLFAHFRSKEDMQMQVLKTAVGRFVGTVIAPALSEPRGKPRIRAFFENWLDWEAASWLPGGCLFIASAIELDDKPGPLRDFLASSQRDWLDALATAAKIGVDEGHFRTDLDTEQFAYELYSIALSFHHFQRLLRDPRSNDRATQAFEDLLAKSSVSVSKTKS